MEISNNCVGHCPKCYSENVEYYDGFIEDDYYCYKAECKYCKTKFREWYSLNYVESIYIDNN